MDFARQNGWTILTILDHTELYKTILYYTRLYYYILNYIATKLRLRKYFVFRKLIQKNVWGKENGGASSCPPSSPSSWGCLVCSSSGYSSSYSAERSVSLFSFWNQFFIYVTVSKFFRTLKLVSESGGTQHMTIYQKNFCRFS